MGLIKTMSQSSAELKSILDRLTALESGETFVTKEMFESLKNADNGDNIMLANYPIGSIYMSVNPTNPTNLFGGNWIAWGTGRVPVGVSTDDSDFNSVEKTGGEKTHVLSESEMATHMHTMDSAVSIKDSIVSNDTGLYQGSGAITFTTIGKVVKTDTAGEGVGHNNMQPYITCYMWKRTA